MNSVVWSDGNCENMINSSTSRCRVIKKPLPIYKLMHYTYVVCHFVSGMNDFILTTVSVVENVIAVRK